MDVLQVHFTRLKCKHMQAFNITLHRETAYSDKIKPVGKCLKIARTAIFCLNKGPQLGNTIRNYENTKWHVLPAGCLKAEAGILSEDCTKLGLFITAWSNQIPFEPIQFSDLHHTLWQGMPQFNYAFMKQIFPFVDFKTAAWLCYSVRLHPYVIRTNKKMLPFLHHLSFIRTLPTTLVLCFPRRSYMAI